MEKCFEEIKSLEIEIACSSSRQNADRLSELLLDSFEEVGVSGRKWSKEEIVNELPLLPANDVQLTGFSFITLADDKVLVKYQSQDDVRKAYRMSIWVLEDGDLKILYHQGTLCS